MKFQIVEIGAPGYPPLLALIQDPPQKLYYVGDLALASSRCISVVGSRKSSDYGRWAALMLSRRLGENGIVVVSGMAAGIDSCAHSGAMKCNGKTIAVLGCGIDLCYPAANRTLRDTIIDHGLLLSEYPPGHPATAYTFPRRNRIISGLSEATVVVSAGLHSGALITAELAAEQGRTVFAVPGNINNIYHLGSNKLLKDGATPLVVIDDILEELGICPLERMDTFSPLSGDEKRLMEQVRKQGESTVDTLCRSLTKPPSHVNGLLTVLEMKGFIHTSMGKIFVAK